MRKQFAPRYSAIRFEQKQALPTVDTDALVTDYLTHDISTWLNGAADQLNNAKDSVKALRSDFGHTPFSIAKLMNVQLVQLTELFR